MTEVITSVRVAKRYGDVVSRQAIWLMISAFIVGSVICSFVMTPRRTEADNGPPSVADVPAARADWPQWGGSSIRNNVPEGSGMPITWDVGSFDRKTGAWNRDGSENVKWVVRVGSQTYGNPVVASGQVYVGTNNGAAYLARYPATVDLGCLIAFSEDDGKFLWQHSSEKLPTGRVHDWPLQGICCAPLVEGERLWFVTSRGEVVCADTQGFHDGEDDGLHQGGWARLFKETPLLDSDLSRGKLPDALRYLLASRGLDLSGRVRVSAGEKEGEYTLKKRSKVEELSLVVNVADGKLTVRNAEGETVVTQPVSLTEGLQDGQLSSALAALLEARGFPAASVSDVETKVPNRGWEMTAEVESVQRDLAIRMEGPNLTAFKKITVNDKREADTIWSYDMMAELGVSQHNMCSCSVTALGDILFVNTSNGVDESHVNIPNTKAPSFIALDKNTGELLWSDASPADNILHGQWSSPTVADVGGQAQVIFAGGDGWVYSFAADRGLDGQPTLLWKFDANSKTSEWILGGRGTRNNIIATPVVYKDRVYVAVGQDPEHGEGIGHLWCLDPTKRGDVSAQLAVHVNDRTTSLPHRRLQAVKEEGEVAIDNPNSAVIWHYDQIDQDGDGEFAFEETMHRSCGTVAIKDDLLYVADFSGLFHCLDAISGKVHWTYDMMSAAWGSPLIVDEKVYIGDEDGEIAVFELTAEPHEPLAEVDMRNSVYSTPIVANNVMFISNKTHLFAITPEDR